LPRLGLGFLICALLAASSWARADAPAGALGPKGTPWKAGGKKLYTEQLCHTCHGVDGSANTEAAQKLIPRPASFLDPQRVAGVSPQRAFSAITYGVAGTGMTQFSHLSDGERWSLAFYVLSLRHDEARAQRGKAAAGLLSSMPDHSAVALARMTEDDLVARISALADPETRIDVLAYFRALAPFEPQAPPAGAKGDTPEKVWLGAAIGLAVLLGLVLALRAVRRA
jgi:mono/diheme cytochrome c family protein